MGKQKAEKKVAPMIVGGIVDSLPEAAKKVLKTSEIKFSVNEQILVTLLAQIIVDIIIKEELWTQ